MKNNCILLSALILLFCIPVSKAQNRQEATGRNRLFFNGRLTKEKPSPLYTFLEQYLSDLQTAGNRRKAEEQMTSDKFSIEYGTLSSIALLNDSLDSRITLHKKRYTVGWYQRNKPVMTVSFPASYELILRKNKSEIEDLLKKRLLAYRPHTVPGMLSPEYPDSTGQKNFFIDTKGYYLLESLRADHYYIKNRQGYSLVVNKQNPPETVANLMTTGEISNRLNLTIVQKKYGFRQDTFRIPLNHWTLFCREEGCTPYFGIEEYDGKKITASLIMDNPSLGYIHLLHFTFPLELLDKLEGTVHATLHAYIPTHNLENLFDDDPVIPRRRSFLFDLPLF